MAKVVNPNDTNHTIYLQGRFVPVSALSLYLTNEASGIETLVPILTSSFDSNKIGTFNFDFNFKERDRFQIKIKQGDAVFYRGTLFATSQETENFDITKDFITV